MKTVIDVPRNGTREIKVTWTKRDGTPQKLKLRFATVHTHDDLCVDAHGRGWSESLAYCNEKGRTK